MLSRRDVLFVLGALPAMTFAAESTAENYDVIVVGSGAAGLSAAVSAAQNGSKRVLILEKTPTLGACKSSKDHSKPRNEVDTSLKSPV